MKTEASILIIDDDLDVLVSAQIFLKQLFTEVRVEQRPDKIPELMEIIDFDVILLDMNFTKGKNDGEEGIYWLNRILSINPAAVVVFITAYGGVDIAVQAMKIGSFDFLVKPWKNDKLLGCILAALQLRKSKLEVEKLRNTNETLDSEINQHFKEFVGNSLAIQKVFTLIEKVAITEADVLILGENGTGKELIAREIHKQSNRRNEVFIPVDLGAIHENLFESELFGHIKGSFTDAHVDKAGRFELAHHGTIFLDEIGNLSLPLQAKLLSVLQNRRVNRIGSGKEIQVDFRLICATNMPLYEMVQKGEFREDLLYRINIVEINVPPLRERIGDIPLLLNFFFKKFTKKYNKPKLQVSQNIINLLSKYSWPGNIRELGHLIERAVILSDGIKLNFHDFASDFSNAKIQGKTEDTLNLKEMEKRHILKAISKNKGNITKAAKDLGIARTALYRRLEKYGL
ncbi:MAG: sigma-54 dependent transcriptional regulator [Bacteroidetes bacterium]|nr:sigma-54 dependent transcriptional regulator [Bacteroidota bacterium]